MTSEGGLNPKAPNLYPPGLSVHHQGQLMLRLKGSFELWNVALWGASWPPGRRVVGP